MLRKGRLFEDCGRGTVGREDMTEVHWSVGVRYLVACWVGSVYSEFYVCAEGRFHTKDAFGFLFLCNIDR